MSIALTASSTGIALAFQKVNSYFGLLGGTAGVLMAGTIPAICYYKLIMSKDSSSKSGINWAKMAFCGVVTLIAFSGAILSVVDAAWCLLLKYFNQYINYYWLPPLMSSKANELKQASKVAKSTRKGAIRRKYQVRSKLRFFKPRTLKVASQPKYARSTSALKMPAKFDKFSVLIHPLNT